MVEDRFQAEAREILHSVQTGSEAQPATYPANVGGAVSSEVTHLP
jgi:hypothetical protein